MSCFGPSLAQPSAATQDPTKHVNYALGMVLGVDDLTQEFSYLAQRDQWLTRDLDGYGTVWGLAVSTRVDGARGPEVVVAPGVAVNPRGQLIRVAPAQCAAFNDWLKPRGNDILQRRIPTANPNLYQLPLYVVVSYRSCLTDPVPIAGEPCRSEQDATAPSRQADDFLLELTLDPPAQEEEDALRVFVQWLRAHIVVGGSSASLSIPQFLDVIRSAVAAAQAELTSPPSPPGATPYLVDLSPITPLSLPAALVPSYLRAVARLWVTELRPQWRPNWLGAKHGCAGSELVATPDQGNQVLLAEVTLTIGPDGLDSAVWVVQGAITVNDDARPFLLQTRLLQEWLLTDGGGSGAAAVASALVAGGIVNADGSANLRAGVAGLRVTSTSAGATATNLTLSFTGYAPPPASGGPQYLVKALPWSTLANLTVGFGGFQPGGLVLTVSKGGAALAAADLAGLQLLVEVTQIG